MGLLKIDLAEGGPPSPFSRPPPPIRLVGPGGTQDPKNVSTCPNPKCCPFLPLLDTTRNFGIQSDAIQVSQLRQSYPVQLHLFN